MDFALKAPYKPAGDQPKAIEQLTAGLKEGKQRQTLLGVTGSGKTFTMANVITNLQQPALVISHNKTLAAQLADEFREFFPDNAVEYFVSYYDYYQPEAYIPRTDTYIAKDSSINDEIDRLRHAAMEAILDRRDVVVVASVSCIYGIGSPADYAEFRLKLSPGMETSRGELLRHLTFLQYTRNDMDLVRGTYRVRGDTIDVHPAGEDQVLRVEFFGPKIESLAYLDDLKGNVIEKPQSASIFPATFFLISKSRHQAALTGIRAELAERIDYFKKSNKLVEAQRIQQRTIYDLEMIEQIGYVSGVENYSRHFDGRSPGAPPNTLLDYFNHSYGADWLLFIDESHMSIPQIGGMSGGDAARKQTLVDFG
ncbi:MAG: DEAD/DEAH box helicase family protein, partial [Patescibacteria group bacterium]